MAIFGRKRSSSQPAQQRNYNASVAGTSAAARAFLTGRPEGGGEGLSSAAAAAALRSQMTTPTPIADIQTKRMQRRGSTSSFGSNTGSVRQPFGGSVQRSQSRSSMTERSFRSPSPGGRRRISSISSDVPPLPTHSRTGSLEGPYRVASPEPQPGSRSMSLDRAGRGPATRRTAPRGGLANVPEGAEPDDFTSFGSPAMNYSRPMSPTPSMSSVSSFRSARPATASGYYYDPATRRLVGTPPSNASNAVKAARLSTQPAFNPAKANLPAAAIPPQRTRPASAAMTSPPAAKSGPTAAQMKAAGMRAGPPPSITVQINKPSTSAQTPPSRPGSSMGRLQNNAIGSNVSLASTRSPASNKVMNNVGVNSSKQSLQPGGVPVSAVTQAARLAAQTTSTPAQAARPAQAEQSARPVEALKAAQAPVYAQAPQAIQAPRPIQTSQPVVSDNVYTIPSPTMDTMRSFQTRTAASLADDSASPAPAPVDTQAHLAPASTQAPVQHARSASQPISQSVSPARSARFSEAPLLGANLVHEPPPRSTSPSKPALKPSSIRTASPSGSMLQGLSDSESQSLRSNDGSSARKKKSVRISLVEDQVPTQQSRNVSAPLTQKGTWAVDDDTNLGPRPALPTFGSVRNRKNGKDNRPALSQRPLSDVVEAELAPSSPAGQQASSVPAGQSTVSASTMSFVNGLGLNGTSVNGTHTVEPEVEQVPKEQSSVLPDEIQKLDGLSDATPAVAVIPATPRLDEFVEEPTHDNHIVEAKDEVVHEDPHNASVALQEDEAAPKEDGIAEEPPRFALLSDIVSRLRPTSEVYDGSTLRGDETPETRDVAEEHVPAVHTEPVEHEVGGEIRERVVVKDQQPVQEHTPVEAETHHAILPEPQVVPAQSEDVRGAASEDVAELTEPIQHNAVQEPAAEVKSIPHHAEAPEHVEAPQTIMPLDISAATQSALEQVAAPSVANAAPSSEPEDWERVRAYWSSLSETRKQQLEQEAALATSGTNGTPPAAPSPAVPAAPLPPWPDQQYQKSVTNPPAPLTAPQPMSARTLRNPEPGLARPASAQGAGGPPRPPMMRPGSSGGPPPGMRPPMNRDLSSTSSVPRPGPQVPPKTGTQAPLKSALKKTNAPIPIAPHTLNRTFSNDSDSDSSFRERRRNRAANGAGSGGRYSMRRSMRQDGPEDGVPQPGNAGGRMSGRSMRESDGPTLRGNRTSMRQGADDRGSRMMTSNKPVKAFSQPNMIRNNQDARPQFQSRFEDSDDEYSPPPMKKTFSPVRIGGFGRRNEPVVSPISESPAGMNGATQGATQEGAALSAGTLRIGYDESPSRKRATFALNGRKQTGLDMGTASAPVTPAKSQSGKPGIFRRLSTQSQPHTPTPSRGPSTPSRGPAGADYPFPPPAIPAQYHDNYPQEPSTSTDKKGRTAEEIAAQMWEKQQKTGKSSLPIVSQKTGKKKKFQGLRRMLRIDD